MKKRDDLTSGAAASRAQAPQTITGAEAILCCLLEEGVDTIFGYPGGAIMPVYDALYGYQDQIRHILPRHEQGAIHAAEGYARVLRKTGVCMATSGPGATNLMTGLCDAIMDSTPLVCITGQVFSHVLGSDAFQETDVIGCTTSISKWNYQITKASEISEVFAKAFYIANSGRPGPVVIDITKDAQLQQVAFHYKKQPKIRSYHPFPKPRKALLEAAADLINNARKPFLLAGHGIQIAGAQAIFKAFIEKTGIPLGCTIHGLSSIPSDHPLHMGMLGMHGNYGPNIKTNECDVLIAIGMRFDDRVT
ncbi:MAG: thiamine pyrophosphate-binding protein, partial [Bacteroidota bacterium]